MLRQAHESVLRQGVNAHHILVADGHPRAEIDDWEATHVTLPRAHGDNGNTPRGIGSMLAMAERYDFIAYLDADNWFHPDHLRSLLSVYQATKPDVCCSFRTLHALDGTLMVGLRDADEAALEHVDTSCYLIHSSVFDYLKVWLTMPRILSPICDRIFYRGLFARGVRFGFSRSPSVAFRSQYAMHYRAAGRAMPEGIKQDPGKDARAWLETETGIRTCVLRMGFYP